MLRTRRGQVVFVNSTIGLSTRAGAGQFAATQHALRAVADTLRDEVNPDGIRVTSVYPGRTATPRQATLHAHEGRTYRPERLMQPDDVAAMVVFVEHEPVDGVAVRGGRQVAGPDALDEIADAPVEDVRVTEVPAELARVVGSYFLPTEMRGVPAAFVVPEDFVRSLARPGRRGGEPRTTAGAWFRACRCERTAFPYGPRPRHSSASQHAPVHRAPLLSRRSSW